MFRWLDKGVWSRPSDKMAVYLEIEDGDTWGIRVTLLGKEARVEAIDGPKCSRYKGDKRYFTIVSPPSLIEKFKGISFEDKLKVDVGSMRRVSKEENERLKR